MEYLSLANTINNQKTIIEDLIKEIKNIKFDSIWSGPAYNQLTTDLKNTIERINYQAVHIETYTTGLNLLHSYKTNKERLMSMQYQLSKIPNTTENANIISSLVSQISSFIRGNQILKDKINSLFQSIVPINSTLNEVSYKFSGDANYIIDVKELYSMFQNNQLTKIPDSGKKSLYDYYTAEEVDQMLYEIKALYSGRDAAVNCALGIMQIAADVGLKLDYDWGGGHTTVTQNSALATGVDCSGFASWAINQGSTETFNTRTTAGLISVGERVDYSQAQKGDILVYNNGKKGHVVLVVENNPETQTFVVAEAATSKIGVILQERSYSSLRSDAYQARDLSSIYNN